MRPTFRDAPSGRALSKTPNRPSGSKQKGCSQIVQETNDTNILRIFRILGKVDLRANIDRCWYRLQNYAKLLPISAMQLPRASWSTIASTPFPHIDAKQIPDRIQHGGGRR